MMKGFKALVNHRRSVRVLAVTGAVLGMLAATPSLAMASTTSAKTSATPASSAGTSATFQPVGYNGGGGDGGHHPRPGGPSAPEVPYAAVLPMGLIALTLLVYRRRSRTQ